MAASMMSENVPKAGTAEAVAALQARAQRAELAVTRLQAELDGLSHRARGAGPEAETLTRLAETLRWDDAPRALRAVLPLARLFRRFSALSKPAPVAPQPQGQAQPAAMPVAHLAPAPPRRLSRRILLAAYRLTRPVALPLAIRLHPLLTGLLRREGILSHADTGPTSADAAAIAELMRSTEAAMLTLALQPRRRS